MFDVRIWEATMPPLAIIRLVTQDHVRRQGKRVEAAGIARTLRFRREQPRVKPYHPLYQAYTHLHTASERTLPDHTSYLPLARTANSPRHNLETASATLRNSSSTDIDGPFH